MEPQWDEEKTLLLIQLYQEKELLWCPSNENYKQPNLKIDSWNEIGEVLDVAGENCKKKMISVMSSFRREKAKVTNSQGTGKGPSEVYSSNWFAYNALQFLNDRNKPRKRSNTASVEVERDETFLDKEVNPIEEIEDLQNTSVDSPPLLQPGPPKKKRPSYQKLDLLKQSFGILKSASESMKTSSTSSHGVNIPVDEIKYFCGFIGNKMTKYSEKTKNSVQHAIHNILFQADHGYLENPNYPQPSTSQINPTPSQPHQRPADQYHENPQYIGSSTSRETSSYETSPPRYPYLTHPHPQRPMHMHPWTTFGECSSRQSLPPSPSPSSQTSLSQDSTISNFEDLV